MLWTLKEASTVPIPDQRWIKGQHPSLTGSGSASVRVVSMVTVSLPGFDSLASSVGSGATSTYLSWLVNCDPSGSLCDPLPSTVT